MLNLLANQSKNFNDFESVRRQLDRGEILSYPTPTNDTEMRLLIKHAELEGKPQIVAIYERALAP